VVRCTFSPARAWRLAAGPASTRTLGRAIPIPCPRSCGGLPEPRRRRVSASVSGHAVIFGHPRYRGAREPRHRPFARQRSAGVLAGTTAFHWPASSVGTPCPDPVALRRSGSVFYPDRGWRFAPACCAAQSEAQSGPKSSLHPLAPPTLSTRELSGARAPLCTSVTRFLPSPREAHARARRRQAQPNPSVEPRPNGMAPGPRSAEAYHPLRGPGAIPSVPSHLER